MPNVIKLKDFSAPELDVYARLTENQLLSRGDAKKAMFIAESPKVIERALDAGCVPVSFLMEEKHVETQAKEILSRCGEVPCFTAELDVLMQITGYKSVNSVKKYFPVNNGRINKSTLARCMCQSAK